MINGRPVTLTSARNQVIIVSWLYRTVAGRARSVSCHYRIVAVSLAWISQKAWTWQSKYHLYSVIHSRHHEHHEQNRRRTWNDQNIDQLGRQAQIMHDSNGSANEQKKQKTNQPNQQTKKKYQTNKKPTTNLKVFLQLKYQASALSLELLRPESEFFLWILEGCKEIRQNGKSGRQQNDNKMELSGGGGSGLAIWAVVAIGIHHTVTSECSPEDLRLAKFGSGSEESLSWENKKSRTSITEVSCFARIKLWSNIKNLTWERR